MDHKNLEDGIGFRQIKGQTFPWMSGSEGGILGSKYANNDIPFPKLSANWKTAAKRLGWFLVPSFLQGYHGNALDQIRTKKLSPTAYLDGMRGVAAFLVYLFHHAYQCYRADMSWGAENQYYGFLRFPIIRLLYGGTAAVSVFFVISGYALSYRPLKLIRSRNTKDLYNTMSSLVFRRLFRLYIPIIVSTFIVFLLVRIGAHELTREFSLNKTYIRIWTEPHIARMPNTTMQFNDWAWHCFTEVHVFGWDRDFSGNEYDVHLWTIPTEYRGSLYLFLVIIATSHLKTIWRYATVFTVILYSYRHSRWDFILFVSGMALAEWDLIRGVHVKDTHLEDKQQQQKEPGLRRIERIFWSIASVIGLYLMSYPESSGAVSPGFIWLSTLQPEWWREKACHFFESWGSVLFVLAVSYLPGWQRLFTSAPAQYLGKISYALYLVHGPTLHVVGYHLEKFAWSLTGTEGNQYHRGWFLGVCLCCPIVIWFADVFWRAVDQPTVKFAKWLESQLRAKSD